MSGETIKVQVNLKKEYFDQLQNMEQAARRGGKAMNLQEVYDDFFNASIAEYIRAVHKAVGHYLKTGNVPGYSHITERSEN